MLSIPRMAFGRTAPSTPLVPVRGGRGGVFPEELGPPLFWDVP